MMAMSLILSLVFICFVKAFTRCMVYSMIVITIVALIVMVVISAINGIWALLIGAAIVLLIVVIIVACYWSDIRTGTILLEISSKYMTERPSVYLYPAYALFLGLLTQLFWIFAVLSLQQAAQEHQEEGTDDTHEIVFLSFGISIWCLWLNFFTTLKCSW